MRTPHDLKHAQELGAKIRWLREKAGLTQNELATRSGISRAYLAALERGLSSATQAPPNPSRRLLKAIATALGIEFETLKEQTKSQESSPRQSKTALKRFKLLPGEAHLQPDEPWAWPEADGVVKVETADRPELGLEVGAMVLVRKGVSESESGLCLIAQEGSWSWEYVARIQQRPFVMARDGSYHPLAATAVIAARAIAILRQVEG